MYNSYFGFTESPFTITPDARFLYMSPRHRDAIAHLKYGLFESNGFVLLTGEVGTGKTVLCRSVLEQLPEGIDAALILNPRQTALELVANICDELHIAYPQDVSSIKVLIDLLNGHLLESYAKGRRTVLIIDEAQNLSEDVLEQVRLLTNLETSKHKLLQILLIGQPELNAILARPQLRQLNQRITARYHIPPLSQPEASAYIRHRLAVAGVQRPLFTEEAAKKVYGLSKGIPRLINVICDRALLGAYAENAALVEPQTVAKAAQEVLAAERGERVSPLAGLLVAAMLLIAIGVSVHSLRPEAKGPAISAPAQQSEIVDRAQAAAETPESSPTPSVIVGAGTVEASVLPDEAAAVEETVVVPPAVEVAEPDVIAVAAVEEPQPVREEAMALQTADAPAAGVDAGAVPADSLELSPSMEGDVVAAVETMEAAAGVDLNELLGDLRCASTTDSGIATLFELWGRRYEAQPGRGACEVAAQQGLHCLQDTGTWNNLRTFNRPAIVEVRGAQGNWQHLVATAIEGERVSLRCADKSLSVDMVEVDQYWFGEYLLLWKSPGLRKRLELGDRGQDVLLLREQLEQVLGIDADPNGDPRLRSLFDEGLRRLVLQFQRRQGLQRDGIAGKATLLLLNNLTGDDAIPRLDRPAS